jgi:hypothetical protein
MFDEFDEGQTFRSMAAIAALLQVIPYAMVK